MLAPLTTQLTTGDRAGWPGRSVLVPALDELDAVLGTWTGTPYADLLEHPDVVAERSALEQVRASAEQARLLGLLALGEHASVLSTTESRVATNALQERWWALHALALTRAGRQADALDALRAVRELLADELGLDPGAELRDLEQAILRQDGWLLAALDDDAPPPVRPRVSPRRRVRRSRRRTRRARSAARPSGPVCTPCSTVRPGRPCWSESPASASPGSPTTWPTRRVDAATSSRAAPARRTTGRRRCGRGCGSCGPSIPS